MYYQIRSYFKKHSVFEVEVPLIHQYTTTAVHIESFKLVDCLGYLQTSPEFFMKRLLAAGYGDIFTITKAFRRNETSLRHNPEFSLLEWYRIGFEEKEIMREVEVLLTEIIPVRGVMHLSYQQCFEDYIDINPHTVSYNKLRDITKSKTNLTSNNLSKDELLQWLMTDIIETRLAKEFPKQIVFINKYPTTQCELAAIGYDENHQLISRRFEVYWDGLELANGYFELTNAQQQKKRMSIDNNLRQHKNLEEIPIDNLLLLALPHMPSCSGVALGLDRLLQIQQGLSSVAETLCFPVEI